MKRIFIAVLTLAIAVLPVFAAAQTSFVVAPDSNGRPNTTVRNAPAYVDARVLAAGVSETHTVPSTATWVLFSSDCGTFYARPTTSVAIPAADVTNGTAGEMNPVAWKLFGETSISVISANPCVVTLSFYR